MKTAINISGCDDSTYFFIDLKPNQAEALRKVAALSEQTGGGCRPILYVSTDPNDVGGIWRSVEEEVRWREEGEE